MAHFEYRKMVPGAGFEPAKHYAEDLESTPFDRSGTPAYVTAWDISFLIIPLRSWVGFALGFLDLSASDYVFVGDEF